MTRNMRLVLIGALVAGLLIVVAAFTMERLASGAASDSIAATDAASSAPAVDGGGDGAGDGAGGADGEAASPGDGGPKSEVLPPVEPEAGLPAPVEYHPLLAGDLPESAAREGGLVDGFPATIPVLDDSSITTSAVASDGVRVLVTLDATVEDSPQRVLDAYLVEFGLLGMQGTASPAVGGSKALEFVRGGDSIVVTVLPEDSGTRYTLSGTLTPAEG
ncbi:hypothetical protein [Agromyces sp. Leaf222]|uniref:hypothetical protein n=1 Tax=Agromyces sp. Leaf222 TaxID=1735688 RepID=UPI0006FC512C|nr:hypothetical protein [Agromyces sp. Leaf222]KQM81430.1 hypothetical protein ASE68_16840 [Agromyces sp. Leaf222]